MPITSNFVRVSTPEALRKWHLAKKWGLRWLARSALSDRDFRFVQLLPQLRCYCDYRLASLALATSGAPFQDIVGEIFFSQLTFYLTFYLWLVISTSLPHL